MGTEKSSGDKESLRTVSSRLKQERERRGWSQSDLAERIGTTQVNVSRWETGQTSPGPYLRQQLAHVFDKSLEELGLVSLSLETGEEKQGQESHEAINIHAITPLVTAPQLPLWYVPYHRNPFFTGREEILAQVYTVLNTHQSAALTQTQAISGLGGVGKTQTAVEYAHRYRDDYTAVLWVNASSLDKFKDEFAGLAVLFDLPEQKEANQDIVISAVKRWLATHTDWLLILDNIDDLDILDKFLPTMSGGKVLLTTRQQALGTLAQSISVDKMEVDEGVLFLLRRSKMLAQNAPLSRAQESVRKQATEIVAALDGLPLALDQAGAYIEETHCGLSAYFMLYRSHRNTLLSRRGRLPTGHPEPVANTWSLSFRRVANADPAAGELLYLLAFLSPESIAEQMLVTGAVELGSVLCPVVTDSLRFNESIELLLHYSLIRRSAEERLLSIHRLVQAVLLDGMDVDLQRMWAERTIRAVNRAFPEVEQATWEECRRCRPHALLCSTYMREYELAFPEAASLLNKTAAYLIDHAQYEEAEPLLIQALAILGQVRDDTHPDRARTLNELGSLYLIQGRYREAEPLMQEALHIRQQTFGYDHPDTATSLTSLARLYHAQGRYGDAESLYDEALRIRQRKLEGTHPDIARSLSDLAKLYTDQGKYPQAEALYLEARQILEPALGKQHLNVANLLNNLALVYRKKGEYEKAENLYVEVLKLQEQVWGRWGYEHPDVAEALNNMARLFRAQGEYTDAEPIYKKALEIRRKVFGIDHPKVAQSLSGLAKLYYSQGKYIEAEASAQEALRIQEHLLGVNHPDLAYTLGALAKIYQLQDKPSFEIEKFILRALKICEDALDPNHPQIALILSNLAEAYQLQGRYPQARPLIKRSLAIRQQSLSEIHPYLAYSYMNLADNFFAQGEFGELESLYKRAIDIRLKSLGDAHRYTATAYTKLANLYVATGKYKDAEELYKTALDIQINALGPNHPEVATIREQLVVLQRKAGRDREARIFEKLTMTIEEKQESEDK